MKLVVITPSKPNLNETQIIVKMFEAGLQTLHVRKNRFSTKELDDYINDIPSHFHNRIIIHSHHKLALKYDLKGFHFTSTHLKNKFKLWLNTKLIYIKKPKLIKSISYRKVDDIYKENRVKTDYCFLGTMFHNLSGELYGGFNVQSIEGVIKTSGRKIYARGGVNEKSVELAYKLGFEGVALYGHLWKSSSPLKRYLDFVAYCKENNIPIE